MMAKVTPRATTAEPTATPTITSAGDGKNQGVTPDKVVPRLLFWGGILVAFIIAVLAFKHYYAEHQRAATQGTTENESTCSTFTGSDQVCWLGRARTGWVSTGTQAGQRPCFGPPMSPDAPYEAWYLTSDGVEHYWRGTEEDKAQEPAFFSFRAKDSDHFPLHYGLC
jgi:hypothetical protein